jgi:hypothetical protein
MLHAVRCVLHVACCVTYSDVSIAWSNPVTLHVCTPRAPCTATDRAARLVWMMSKRVRKSIAEAIWAAKFTSFCGCSALGGDGSVGESRWPGRYDRSSFSRLGEWQNSYAMNRFPGVKSCLGEHQVGADLQWCVLAKVKLSHLIYGSFSRHAIPRRIRSRTSQRRHDAPGKNHTLHQAKSENTPGKIVEIYLIS